MTPFLLGLSTAYLANRDAPLPSGQTIWIVLLAALLGIFALLMFALEGLVCILLAVPLGLVTSLAGGIIGRQLAAMGHRRGRPLLSIAALPLMFVAEAALPPMIIINSAQTIIIAAPPAAVWRSIISPAPIGPAPPLLSIAGFAYPISGTLLGTDVGALRIGEFSTGRTHERVTAWDPGRRLALAVLDQPEMMTEMSPYRDVHAPHLDGYFETQTTSFELAAAGRGETRLTIRAVHRLRIDPLLYWEPLARWAIAQNLERVLASLKQRAEAEAPINAPPPARR